MSTGSITHENTHGLAGLRMKIKGVFINNFRSFSSFAVPNVGRITLLVGTNNSGKTTVLEALHMLLASGEPSVMWSILSRRGEDLWIEREGASAASSRQIDIRRLFRGHEIDVGSGFDLRADTDIGPIYLQAKIGEPRPLQPTLFDTEAPPPDSGEDYLPPLTLSLEWSPSPGRPQLLPIGRRGGISLDAVRRVFRPTAEERLPVRYVTASSLSPELITMLFEEIVLTEAEDLVIEAMRIIDPEIERIASSGGERIRSARYPNRGGILVKLKNVKDRVPIGSMGDGIWRMLGLALSVVESADGMLLVDEIDTGLHHTAMKDLWRFLYRCAKRFDVQIVATTHSRDCFQSLAAICREDVGEGSDVTIHRIEKGQSETVAYSEQEIVAAAEYDMEVR